MATGPPSPQAQTGPARERALAGPTGSGRPVTGISTTTSTASMLSRTVQLTNRARCSPAIRAARPQPPS